MSIGAQPLAERDVVAICERKVADFRHKAPRLEIRHVDRDNFVDLASDDPDIGFELRSGFIDGGDLKDPVLVRIDDTRVVTCPPLAMQVLADEPPEIHRAFVEGVLMRKLFRFFVPATLDGGPNWEVTHQVREIMQKHFAFQLVVCESVLELAS